MLKYSANVLVMLPSAFSTWSLLCDGQHLVGVGVLFHTLARLRVHSVEGVNMGLRLQRVVLVGNEQGSQERSFGMDFRVLRMG